MREGVVVAGLFIMLVALHSAIAEAHEYAVTTLDDHDDGVCDIDCTLREAINAAQSVCWDAVDQIIFDPSLSGTILLQSELPPLTCPMVVDGGGRIVVSGGKAVGYGLTIYAWEGLSDPDVTVRSLSFEEFTRAGIYVQPSGQVLIEGVKVRDSDIGLVIYSTSAGTRVTLRGLEVYGNERQGLYVIPSAPTGETEVRVEGSKFHSNYQGIWIHGVNEIRNVMIGDPSNANSGNYVYGNEAEGILLSGSVVGAVITYNSVGTDGSSPKPNLLGGIVLANGVSDSKISSNEVAYNGYQNILLMGIGTESNSIEGNYVHCDPTSEDPLCYIGIWIGGGASENEVSGNVISGHKYEGIALVGEADRNIVRDNKVGSFNADGSYNGNRNIGNGAGIAVINAAAPDIHYPFPVYATSSSANVPGPRRVQIQGNEVAGNRGAGVILIRATDFEAYGNEVYENSLHGFYWVGSSGAAHFNEVHHNDGSGFRVEPYWGLDSPSARATSPSTYGDDVLSSATSGIGIYDNYVGYNKGYGLLIIDNPWASLDEVGNKNTFRGNEPLEAAKLWLGHVRVVDPGGGPIAGLTVDVLRGGDDSDNSPDYSCVTGADGRCGPPGFDYNNASTWFMLVEEELAYEGQQPVLRRYNPHGFALAGKGVNALYYWNGLSDVGESGGSLESPPGSGAFRYQYAQLIYAVKVREAVAIEECYVRSELDATSEYPLSPGDAVNYTLKLIPSCSRPLEVEAVMKVPDGLSPLAWYSPVGELSYDDRSRLMRWKGSVSGNATVLEVIALVSSGAGLGEPILTRANLTCLSPNCVAYSSDDPATPTREDHTLRPVSLVTLRTPPSRELRVPFNLSPYGEFSVSVSGCDKWSLSLGYPVENGSVLSNPSGVLTAFSPRRVSSCEVKFTLLKPSGLSRPLFESKLSYLVEEFLIRLEVVPEVIEPELRVEVRPEEPALGKPLSMRLALVNPSGFDLSASLRIPLNRFKLLSVVHSTHGELERIGRDLIWRLELPAGRSSSAQLTLIPEAEGELSLAFKLLYSAGGPEYERTFELRLRVSKEAVSSSATGESTSLMATEAVRSGANASSPMTSPYELGEVTESKHVGTEVTEGFSIMECCGSDEGRKLGENAIFLLVALILASILSALAYSATRR